MTIIGLAAETVQGGYVWADPGATASDVCNGDVTSIVLTSKPITSPSRTVLGVTPVRELLMGDIITINVFIHLFFHFK